MPKQAIVEETEQKQRSFTKEQILKSEAYKGKIDLLNALLEDDVKYTKKQVEETIKTYLESEVK